ADRDIDLIISPPAPGANLLQGDALRLEQILINLTGNAIKFTERGHVDVNISTLAEEEGQIALRFSVRDTGIGISEDAQAQIFAPFSQADASTTRRFGGTGLGLTICRRLVALMGGEMGIISAPGEGSEFWFTLTFERTKEIRHSDPAMAHVGVLIADDNPIAREALRMTASSLGWQATAVGSGEAAVQRVLSRQENQGPGEVVVLDWKMPGMDGLAAARAIHEALKDKHEPIIIMVTAHSRDALLASPDSQLVDAVLTMPVTASTLYDAVARAYRKRHGEAEPEHRPQTHWQRLADLRMLVVDDSDINRDLAYHIFTAEGASVTLANDGRQAVDLLRAHPGAFDIVLMDVHMPVMDGYEATRVIHGTPGLTELPVVALTAGAFKDDREAAIAAGMTEFITKPFDVDAAIALIRKLTGWEDRPAASKPLPGTQGFPDGVASFRGLDVERGLTIWKDPILYRQYLRSFADNHVDSVREMARLDHTAAAALAHKLKGTAGNLALVGVAESAGEVERKLREGHSDADAFAKLEAAVDAALESIARYAPVGDPANAVLSNAMTPGQVASLLARALDAFDTDSPDAVEPILSELETRFPPARVDPLRVAAGNFDFCGGKVATRALAEELGISLET
ncbi:MAG: response regulator, partial [Thiobacillaceae bacterium]